MSVGESLAQARDACGMSVEDVSEATRIRGGLIRQIEADDFSGCGGAVYSRGHIRAIGRLLHIDPEPLVAEFDRTHASEAAAPPLVPTPAVAPEDAARAERKQPNWAAAMAVVLVIICVAAAVSLIGNRGGGKKPIAQSSAPPPVATQTPQATQPPASPPPSAQAQLPNDAIAAIRVTSAKTWLSVETTSGQLLFQGLLIPGERKVFRDAHGLRLIIGNAPAVDLVANGRDVGVPRSQGVVAHVTILQGQAVQYA